MINSTNKSSLNTQQSPAEKLVRRINREFKKCTYIGDIQIDDEEYQTVILFLKHGYEKILSSPQHETINPLFAVGLVQIGIRYYDGRFWSHVQKELKLEKLPMNHHGWIGKSFYKTLIRFGKFHVAENEFMNNILLHCFITKHYANDLFDFLFAYYQIDLERDLSRNSAEMRKYLMQTMSKGEASARAYKIKKHTADAVSANERGCKIRVGRILRFMDNALFNDLYPENSQNRIAQLFCEWAKSSGRFEYARRATAGLTRKGEKRFSTPFIHFDTKREKFYLVLPQQYIHLNAEDDIPQMYWRIRIENFENILEVSSDSCVTGCKTEKIDCFEVPADRLLQEIEIELLKDSGDKAKRFLLKSASIRFFDNDWDMIDSVTYTKYLPEGQAYAFTDPDGVLQTDSDAIDGFEKSLGYGLYTLTLQKGDVLRLPDGKAKSVGKPLEEGLLQQKLVHGAYVMRDEKISIYSTTPSVYFRMKPNQENGTLIIINGERFRFDAEKCVRFDLDEKTDEKGYILKLSEYIVQDGIYEVIINVPESKKKYRYNLAYIKRFGFTFDRDQYIFQSIGKISLSQGVAVYPVDESTSIGNSEYRFIITDQTFNLYFHCAILNSKIAIQVPVFKWSFDAVVWNVEQPPVLWHENLPPKLYFLYPSSMLTLYTEATDDDNTEENILKIKCQKNNNGVFECDVRKIFSWLDIEHPMRQFYLDAGVEAFPFLNIITRNSIDFCSAEIDAEAKQVRLSISCLGNQKLFIDIFNGGDLILNKIPYSTEVILLPYNCGMYQLKVVLYEYVIDEFNGGDCEYLECDSKKVEITNCYNYTGKIIELQKALLNGNSQGLSDRYLVKVNQVTSQNHISNYQGTLYLHNKKGDTIIGEIVAIFDNSKNTVRLKGEERYILFYNVYQRRIGQIDRDTFNILGHHAQHISNIKGIQSIEWTFREITDKIQLRSLPIENLKTFTVRVVDKKYNWPIDKTNLSHPIIRKLNKQKIYTSDSIIAYGLLKLCDIPCITPMEAVEIIRELIRIKYKILGSKDLIDYYFDQMEE